MLNLTPYEVVLTSIVLAAFAYAVYRLSSLKYHKK